MRGLVGDSDGEQTEPRELPNLNETTGARSTKLT